MKTPAQTAGVRNTVILCVIYYGIRPAGVVTGKPGDTRLLCPGIAFLWSQRIYRAEPKKTTQKSLQTGIARRREICYHNRVYSPGWLCPAGSLRRPGRKGK